MRPTSLYSSPWVEGTWRLRDAVDYMVTADHRDAATTRAKFKSEMLYNRYQVGAQHDSAISNERAVRVHHRRRTSTIRMAPVELLRRMAFMGVRVKQLDRDVSYGGTTYPKGTWVIPMDQEFAQLVRELFEPQKLSRTWATTRRTTPPAGRCRIR